jgi:hypothetical protein
MREVEVCGPRASYCTCGSTAVHLWVTDVLVVVYRVRHVRKRLEGYAQVIVMGISDPAPVDAYTLFGCSWVVSCSYLPNSL